MRVFLKMLALATLTGTALVLFAVIALLSMAVSGMPDHQKLASYSPAVSSRVFSADGRQIGLFARENRAFVPLEEIPDHVIAAFMSAEDKNFYSHRGVDPMGVGRAVLFNITNFGERRMQGASTITQQVAENVLLADARPKNTLDRFVLKIREALVSLRIEEVLTKDQIMEIYLNQIFLGFRSYGVEAASQTYFGKSVRDISLADAAYLAVLPKAPNNYNPTRHADRALARREYVIGQMVDNGFIRPAQGAEALAQPLPTDPKPRGSWTDPQAGEFVEEVRRDLIRRFGADAPYARGFIVRTTVDLDTQAAARTALQRGLNRVNPNRQSRFGGAVGMTTADDQWLNKLRAARYWRPSGRPVLGIVLDNGQNYGLDDGRKVPVPQPDKDWAARSGRALADGQFVWLQRAGSDREFRLRRSDAIQGALASVNVHTGGVIAMAGGYDLEDSGFNRATQAQRQPGSSIKPIFYAAALEQGMTPETKVSDNRIRGGGWSPENADRRYYGMMTMRQALVLSRNTVTVRIARRVGMRRMADYARRFGVYDDLPNDLTMALGAGETTVLKMTSAFAVFPNGGRYIPPVFYDRLQDSTGRTVWRSDRRACASCDGAYDARLGPPKLEPWGVQVVSARTAWEMSSILREAVTRGTGKPAQFSHPVAGKTGTTSDYRDAWFVGFTPSYATGVYVGYDRPRTIFGGASGGKLAGPIFRQFMMAALADHPIEQFEPSNEVLREIETESRIGILAQLQSDPAGAQAALAALRTGGVAAARAAQSESNYQDEDERPRRRERRQQREQGSAAPG
ncbi:MAG: PBP1A family penicillin-binding protein [Hyphomonadaceae bacterium]|jgi:penicillin-binding protein 1A|nr:PBP1A family penicillin-binding protein [Hyphomonadaceae bacterium]